MARDDTATLAELEDEFRRLGERVAADSARRGALERLIAKRKAEAEADAKVKAMSALQREALKKVLERY